MRKKQFWTSLNLSGCIFFKRNVRKKLYVNFLLYKTCPLITLYSPDISLINELILKGGGVKIEAGLFFICNESEFIFSLLQFDCRVVAKMVDYSDYFILKLNVKNIDIQYLFIDE